MKSLILILFIGAWSVSPLYASSETNETLQPAPLETPAPIAPVVEADEVPTAQEIAEDADEEKETLPKINEVVQRVFDRVMASKDRYPELANFNKDCMSKNADGFLTLEYKTEVPSSRGEMSPFEFKLDVEPIKKTTYKTYAGYYDYILPLIDLQFSGYMIKHPLRRQFDILKVLEEYAEELADYQQKFMPLKFVILPDRKTYRVGELIHFKVALANVSDHNILVKDLTQDTMFFTVNRAVWGTKPGQVVVLTPREQRIQERIKRQELRALLREKRQKNKTTLIGKKTREGSNIILRAGEALAIDFTGEGYRRAQEVEIRGIYKLNIKGLRPTGKSNITIVKE